VLEIKDGALFDHRERYEALTARVRS
jgi:hypothetical protein